jgi:hypothetical protein
MVVGDIVKSIYDYHDSHPLRGIRTGIVIETNINMWGEEVIPSGVKVLWTNSEIEIVYSDEIEVIR